MESPSERSLYVLHLKTNCLMHPNTGFHCLADFTLLSLFDLMRYGFQKG